ncbi:MAG: FkbM family methyltransferase [Planctomycetes bacterium]|nr:FkbM family methyltransferase [Planctomycetota bacterium]
MKKQIVNAINRLLRPIGVEIIRHGANVAAAPIGTNFQMSSLLQRLAQRGTPIRNVIDIGSSDGKWSLECMQHLPDASYLAIEPLEERLAALENNKRRFANFDYAICVAGDVDGQEVTLNVTADLDGSTVDGQNPGSKRTCGVRTIDSLIADRQFAGPLLLKFDTHGYEMPILAGASQALANTTAIIMETYNFSLTSTSLRFPEMCAHMERLGFRPADIADPMLRMHDNAFWQIDILFLRADSETFNYQHYR